MRRLLFLIFLGAIGAYAFRMYCYEGIYIASESMEPTLPKQTHVFVNKYTLKFRQPHHGEIIMFQLPGDPSKGHIKRVIALPGEEIEIRKKIVYLNGVRQNEPYVQFLSPDVIFKGDDTPVVTVPENTVFVMGDNRDVSGDSRDWHTAEGQWSPFLSQKLIQGLVILQ